MSNQEWVNRLPGVVGLSEPIQSGQPPAVLVRSIWARGKSDFGTFGSRF